MRLRTDSRGGHVPELCRYSPRDERDFPIARARDEAGGCRVVASSKELREVPERRGRGVRADELRRGVAPAEVTTGHIYRGIIPFVLIQVLGLGMLWMFPQVVTIVPNLMGH